MAGVKSTHVTSYVPDKRVKVQFSKWSGPDLPLVGRVIVAGVNIARQSEATERAKKFVDVDFRGQFWAAIWPVLKDTAWLKAEPMQRSTALEEPVTAAMVARAGELSLNTNYFITINARRLNVITDINFHMQGQGQSETPAASNLIRYLSAAIGPQEGDEAIALWSANQGAAYKRVAAESVVESAKLLRYALLAMGGDPPKPQRRLRLKHADIEMFSYDALIIEETAERILFQDVSGTFHSFAAEDVDFDGQPSLYAQKRASDAEKAIEAEGKTEWAQYWKKWGTEHPGDPCVPALASFKSASECVGAACSTPLVLMAGYQKNCKPDPETRILVHLLRRKWEKETTPGASD